MVASVCPRPSVNPMAQYPPGRKPTSAPSQSHESRSETRVNASNASEALAPTEMERMTEWLTEAIVPRGNRFIGLSVHRLNGAASSRVHPMDRSPDEPILPYTRAPMNGALEAIRRDLAANLAQAVTRIYGVPSGRIALERPPRIAMGDLASPVAFDLAKTLRKAPRAIAAEIASGVTLPPTVREARVEGGGY